VFPRNFVCFRNICINTLHKGDNDDDDDNNNIEVCLTLENISMNMTDEQRGINYDTGYAKSPVQLSEVGYSL
jgi:hypothetical protein